MKAYTGNFKNSIQLLTFILLVSCGRNQTTKSNGAKVDSNNINKSANSISTNQVKGHWFKPEQFTPLSFIDSVTIKNKDTSSINMITISGEFQDNWVKTSDLDSLMTLIESTQKGKCTLNPLSSYIPIGQTAEIGGYAILFINSYRNKSKVTLGLFSCPKTDKESVDEIKNWWRTYKQNK